jgi:uncharacterized protein YbjQ (UPF0145 family)
MSLSTSGFYDFSKYEVKGIVTATHTEGLSLFRGALAELGGLLGGKSDLMNKKVNDVMDNLILKLKGQIGVNERIVGLSVEFAEFGRSEGATFLSGIATGTLITPKGQKGGAKKTLRTTLRRRR